MFKMKYVPTQGQDIKVIKWFQYEATVWMNNFCTTTLGWELVSAEYIVKMADTVFTQKSCRLCSFSPKDILQFCSTCSFLNLWGDLFIGLNSTEFGILVSLWSVYVARKVRVQKIQGTVG